MRALYIAAVVGVVAVPVHSEPLPAPAAIQPAVDSPQKREALRKMTVCLAGQRPRWARAILSHPYLSDAQADAAAELISGRDGCLRAPEVEMTFRTSTVIGVLAEYFVHADLPKTDLKRVASSLATMAPLNVSEDFALCLAARSPTAALDLTFSEPGSGEESRAAGIVGTQVASCSTSGERLNVDVQALRSLVSTALYRGVTATVERGR